MKIYTVTFSRTYEVTEERFNQVKKLHPNFEDDHILKTIATNEFGSEFEMLDESTDNFSATVSHSVEIIREAAAEEFVTIGGFKIY